MVISFLDMRNECNGLHLNPPVHCGFLVFLFTDFVYYQRALSSMSSVHLSESASRVLFQ